MTFKKTKIPKGVELIEFAWRPGEGSPRQTLVATPADSLNMLDAFGSIYPGLIWDGWREPAAGPKLATELLWTGKRRESGWRIYKHLGDGSVFLMDTNYRARSAGDGKTPKVTQRLGAILSGVILSQKPNPPVKRKALPGFETPDPLGYSLRLQQADKTWKNDITDMTLTEAKRRARSLAKQGYYPAVFYGRKKVWEPR